MNKPKQIWIERDDECPYFYVESELADACPPLVRYVREDEIDRLRAEVEALRKVFSAAQNLVNNSYTPSCDGDRQRWLMLEDTINAALRGEEEK